MMNTGRPLYAYGQLKRNVFRGLRKKFRPEVQSQWPKTDRFVGLDKDSLMLSESDLEETISWLESAVVNGRTVRKNVLDVDWTDKVTWRMIISRGDAETKAFRSCKKIPKKMPLCLKSWSQQAMWIVMLFAINDETSNDWSCEWLSCGEGVHTTLERRNDALANCSLPITLYRAHLAKRTYLSVARYHLILLDND